ncbi:hypothetical protein FSP39_002235 [Pinctada imbricata]|uniref:MARVEL domain-containing protein n=1 Tax=Pinctada imbricata TaxID=66713 RepID=A0AA88XY15_PINIB|nr:hypothetical protein FSP39_002235 [Pinctada imbricata]
MSTTYEVDSTQQTTTTSSSSDGIGLDRSYPRSIPAILKIVEIVLCLITFICASANYAFSCCYGGGWVQFVAMSALITTLLFFLFHLFRVIRKLPGPWVFIVSASLMLYVYLF